MIGRPSRRLWLDAVKAEFGQIKLIDKDIDRPDRIVLARDNHPAARETACSGCGHRQRQNATSNPPAKSLQNRIMTPFSHSLGHLRLGRASSKSSNVRYVAKSRSKFRAFSETP